MSASESSPTTSADPCHASLEAALAPGEQDVLLCGVGLLLVSIAVGSLRDFPRTTLLAFSRRVAFLLPLHLLVVAALLALHEPGCDGPQRWEVSLGRLEPFRAAPAVPPEPTLEEAVARWRAHPEDVEGALALTERLLLQDNYAMAHFVNDRTLLHHPESPDARALDAMWMLGVGLPECALATLDAVLLDAPDHLRATAYRAVVQARLGAAP